jgi:hypothetical protein
MISLFNRSISLFIRLLVAFSGIKDGLVKRHLSDAYEKATVKYKLVLIGCIAKHLFVFTPKVSHCHAYDSRRPNQVHGLT